MMKYLLEIFVKVFNDKSLLYIHDVINEITN